MEFSPSNPIVRLCLQGMELEAQDNPEDARAVFNKAWDEAGNDFEKFLTAHYLSRHQKTTANRLKWLQTALEHAQKVNDDSVKTAFPELYRNIGKCYADLGNRQQ